MLVEQILDSGNVLRCSVAELLLLAGDSALEERLLMEASVRSLWRDAVRAFPRTQRRQHVIDRVRTEEVAWQPFPGLKILLGNARVLGERYPDKPQRRYRANIMFRGVKFYESPRRGLLKVTNRGSSPSIPKGDLYFERLNFNDSVRVRCSCPDFRWRFNWECEEQQPSALLGPKAPPYTPPNPARYRGPANPSGLPGICKHVMNFALVLHRAGAVNLR